MRWFPPLSAGTLAVSLLQATTLLAQDDVPGQWLKPSETLEVQPEDLNDLRSAPEAKPPQGVATAEKSVAWPRPAVELVPTPDIPDPPWRQPISDLPSLLDGNLEGYNPESGRFEDLPAKETSK